MSRKRKKQRGDRLRVGEVVRLGDVFGMFPETICRIDALDSQQLLLSVGETRLVVSRNMANVIERHLPEPASWLACEVEYIREMAQRCDCKDCRENLVIKEAQLAAERAGSTLTLH